MVVVFTYALAGTLDWRHGEGVVAYVIALFLAPLLASSYFLLRMFANTATSMKKTLLAAFLFAFAHLAAQLLYEPSETGGPNFLVLPFTLLSVLGWIIVTIRRTRSVPMNMST